MKEIVKKYFECECDDDIIRIYYDTEEEWNNFVEMAMFSRGQFGKKYSILHKLRHIWRILKYGNPFNDQIIFEKENFEKFKEFINSIEIK